MTVQRALTADLFGKELIFSASRSSGTGGQNVNKVNTKVSLKVDIAQSGVLTPDEKEILLKKLATRLTNDGVLLLSSQDKRSQIQNKEAVLLKFEQLLAKALHKPKARKATKPSKGAVQSRIKKKKQNSEKKKWRKRPTD